MKLDLNSRLKNLVFFAIILIYAFLLLHTAYQINISEDETYTLNTTSRSLSGIITQSYNFEAQPPVYFLIFAFWRHIDSSIFFAKLLSILFIGVAAYYFKRLVVLISGNEFSKWMVLIFLLNPSTVWAALFMRTYALLVMLSTMAIYHFFRYYQQDRKRSLYAFMMISFIGMYTQYFFTFLVAALAFAVLVFRGWKSFSKFFVYLVPLIILFLPNFIFLPNQIGIQESHRDQHFVLNTIDAILHTPQNYLVGVNLIPSVLINRTVRLLFLASVILGYLNLFRKVAPLRVFFLDEYNMVLLAIILLRPTTSSRRRTISKQSKDPASPYWFISLPLPFHSNTIMTGRIKLYQFRTR